MTRTFPIPTKWARQLLLAACAATAALRPAAAAQPVSATLLDHVNALQGTDSVREFSHGNTLPLVGTPWSMTDWTAQTHGDNDERWFFRPRDHRFVGFRATHSPCPWAGDWGDATFTPQTGPVALGANDRACRYDPAAATFRPDYTRVVLPRYKVTAELTASERCGVLRLTFDPAEHLGRLVIDPAGECQLTVTASGFDGYTKRRMGGAARGDFRCYFAGEVDRPITGSAGIRDAGPRLRPLGPPYQATGTNLGGGPGYVEFDVTGKPTVQVRIATSFISPEQARRNLDAETTGGFDGVRARTAAAWNDKLGRLTVDGATDEQRATFYSCLYRSLKFPRKMFELGADGQPVHFSPWNGKVVPGVAYTDSGLWDTYRTLFPFLSIAYPDQLGEMVAGWLNAYREGGWLPQWPNPGGYRGMTGSHADSMIADAIAKGVPGFDVATAYAALRKDAFEVPPRGREGREAMADYLRLGYVPVKGCGYWVSTSLDFAYDDWCVAQAAKLTGHLDDYRALMARSMNYRKLWDPSVGFMRGKDAAGHWDPDFDPLAWGGGYTESGPWQASWAVQHDPAGLADLTGGPAAFAKVLDALFDQPSVFHIGGYPGEIHEMTEFAACKMGQFAPNNQPSFHIPYLYAAVGQPWKTEHWARRTCRELYNAGPTGYSGDEDNGSASSWYLLNAMGLFPLTPGQPTYVFTSPLFRSIRVAMPNGKTFTVSAPDNSDARVHVASRTVDGQPDTNLWITHAQVAAGVTVVDQMTDKPAERAVAPAELPYSAKTEMQPGH